MINQVKICIDCIEEFNLINDMHLRLSQSTSFPIKCDICKKQVAFHLSECKLTGYKIEEVDFVIFLLKEIVSLKRALYKEMSTSDTLRTSEAKRDGIK